MRTLKFLALATAALCAAVVLFALATLPPAARRLQPAASNPAQPVVAGAYHVHTLRSDGTGTVDEIAAAAARAGLQFVIFTDHGDGTRPADPPSYRSGVLCIDGVEIGTSAGHYVAIGMDRSPYPLGGEPRDVIDDVRRLGGFGVAAHPDSPKPALRWRDWAAPFDAIEWLNSDSEWRDKPALMLAHTFLEFMLRGPESLASLFARPDITLARFDALTRQRRLVALAAADAHARMGLRGTTEPREEGTALKMPSYESVFRTFAIRVQLDRPLTGRADADAVAVRGALAAGHVYTAIDALATPPAFEFGARSGPFSARGGDTLSLGGPVEIDGRVNESSAALVLFQNGRRVAEGTAAVHYQAPERPAVFRIEVYIAGAAGRPPIPWIVSNPIYAGGLLEPRQPIARAEPTFVRPVDGAQTAGGGPTAWALEHEAHSPATFTVDGTGAVMLDYALAPAPFVNQFAALAHEAGELNGCDRLHFRARADRPMRLSVQVRIPSGSDAERWHRSVYVDDQPRDVSVFLDDLRPIGTTSTYTPDFAKVKSVLFVVDRTNARPGTKGKVWLEDVRWAGAGK